jgi:peptide/nickel transport system substrate-binding protein
LEKAGLKQGRVLYSDVLPWHPAYVDNVTKDTADLNKAKDVLSGAGYSGIGTKLLDKSGTPITPLRLLYISPNPANNEIAQNIKQAYTGLGISLELVGVDFNTYSRVLNGTATNPLAYDLWLGSWQTDYDPENFGEVWQNVPELNSGAYKNEKLTQLYASALVESDVAKRNGFLAQVQQVEAEELPYIYLYAQYELLVVNKKVAGVAQTLGGAAYSLYTDWYLPKP